MKNGLAGSSLEEKAGRRRAQWQRNRVGFQKLKRWKSFFGNSRQERFDPLWNGAFGPRAGGRNFLNRTRTAGDFQNGSCSMLIPAHLAHTGHPAAAGFVLGRAPVLLGGRLGACMEKAGRDSGGQQRKNQTHREEFREPTHGSHYCMVMYW